LWSNSTVGIGRTGTVDWCTTAKTSHHLQQLSGDGFFINTTGGAITVTLPSSPQQEILLHSKIMQTLGILIMLQLVEVDQKLDGACVCATLEIEAQSVTLIYVDGTKGWKDIHDSTSNVQGASFVAATGGTDTHLQVIIKFIHSLLVDVFK
jgi:hypothetical protein